MPKSHTEDYLRTRATQIVAEKVAGSTLFDDKAEEKIPRFSPSGKILINCVATLAMLSLELGLYFVIAQI